MSDQEASEHVTAPGDAGAATVRAAPRVVRGLGWPATPDDGPSDDRRLGWPTLGVGEPPSGLRSESQAVDDPSPARDDDSRVEDAQLSVADVASTARRPLPETTGVA